MPAFYPKLMLNHKKSSPTVILGTFGLVLMLTLQSCVTQSLMGTWQSDRDFAGDIDKVLIMGLINNVTLRSEVENRVLDAANKASVTATNGMSMFPPELGRPFDDIERVKTRLRDRGFSAIMTVALIDVRAQRYVGSTTTYEPLIFYDRFRNYYYRTYELVYTTGYFAQSTNYFAEINLYELNEGKLLWSGRSAVFAPHELDATLPRVSNDLFKELKRVGLIDNQSE